MSAATVRDFHGIGGRCCCYVERLPDAALFGARRGIHNPTCCVYRASMDPVDQMADDDYRRMAEITGTPEIVGALAEIGAERRLLEAPDPAMAAYFRREAAR